MKSFISDLAKTGDERVGSIIREIQDPILGQDFRKDAAVVLLNGDKNKADETIDELLSALNAISKLAGMP